MEPKQSMTRYACVVVAFLTIRALTGGPSAVYGAVALMLAGLILETGYRIAVGRGPRPVPGARKDLDGVVRKLWLGASVAALAPIGVVAATGWELWNPPRALDALITAATAAGLAIFVSALIDWYWILPRMAGVTRRAPCEEAGGQSFTRVTGVWLFHRGVATLIVASAPIAVCLYMQHHTDDAKKTTWLVLAAALGAATTYFLGPAQRMIWMSLRPMLRVGDVIDIHGRRAYVVDVSLQGASYRWLDEPVAHPGAAGDAAAGDPRPTVPFDEKAQGSFPLDDFSRFSRVRTVPGPCANRCCAINWYCRHNPKAYQ